MITVALSLQDVPEFFWDEVSLFSFFLVDLAPFISNYAPTRAKRRTEDNGDQRGSFVRIFFVGSRFHRLKKDGKLSQLSLYDRESNLDHLHQPANFVS